jgi:hypothetical protein
MSIVMLILMLLAVGGASAIIYGGYRLYRSAEIDDEAAERKRLADEAAKAEELEKLYPGIGAVQNKERVKRFVRRT